MDRFKTILREALKMNYDTMVLIENQYVQGVSRGQMVTLDHLGICDGDWMGQLNKSLFPNDRDKISKKQPILGGLNVAKTGKVMLVAEFSHGKTLRLFMPPESELACQEYWKSLQGQSQQHSLSKPQIGVRNTLSPRSDFAPGFADPNSEEKTVLMNQSENTYQPHYMGNEPQEMSGALPPPPATSEPFSLSQSNHNPAPVHQGQQAIAQSSGHSSQVPFDNQRSMPLAIDHSQARSEHGHSQNFQQPKTQAPSHFASQPSRSVQQNVGESANPAEFNLQQNSYEASNYAHGSFQSENQAVTVRSEQSLEAANQTKQAAKGADLPDSTAVNFSPHITGDVSYSNGQNKIDGILGKMMEFQASDLHLSPNEPIIFRVHGEIYRTESQPLSCQDLEVYLKPIIPPAKKEDFNKNWDLDFSYDVKGLGRFRVNLYRSSRGVSAVIRYIPERIPSMEELKLPSSIRKLCHLRSGLVLITGPTGSGKSTTLAAMIDHINSFRSQHILTIEDPIEFVHPQKRSLVSQREVGKHTNTFNTALRAALREDPDVILIGELRDIETTAMAIETAETGHLVFATLHTNSAVSTVDRIIDQFPGAEQNLIRNMLSSSIRGIVAQTLCKKQAGGRCAAYEILMPNDAVSAMIRENKIHMIPNHMQTQKDDGNILLNESLIKLVSENQIDIKEAWARSNDRRSFEELAKRKRIVIPQGLT